MMKVYDCGLIRLVIINMIRKYGVHRTNQVLTEVRMPRVEINGQGTDLLVEVQTQHSTGNTLLREAEQSVARTSGIRRVQQLEDGDGVIVIGDSDFQIDLVDTDGKVVGTIAESDT